MLHSRKMASAVWVRDSAQGCCSCPFISLRRSVQPSLSSCAFICLRATLPLLQPRVSGCEWYFVCWPYKNLLGFLVDSSLSLADRTLIFKTDVMWLFFTIFVALGWGTWHLRFQTSNSSRGTFEIIPPIVSHCMCLWD